MESNEAPAPISSADRSGERRVHPPRRGSRDEPVGAIRRSGRESALPLLLRHRARRRHSQRAPRSSCRQRPESPIRKGSQTSPMDAGMRDRYPRRTRRLERKVRKSSVCRVARSLLVTVGVCCGILVPSAAAARWHASVAPAAVERGGTLTVRVSSGRRCSLALRIGQQTLHDRFRRRDQFVIGAEAALGEARVTVTCGRTSEVRTFTIDAGATSTPKAAPTPTPSPAPTPTPSPVPASSSPDPPVNYLDESVASVGCHEVTDGSTTYAYVENDPPTRAWAYAGTDKIFWSATMYVWSGGEWVSTRETGGAYPGSYVYDRGWYDLEAWAGSRGSGALELSAAPGYSYSSVDTTEWLDAAGNVIHSYQNSTTIANC